MLTPGQEASVTERDRQVEINMSGIPVAGVGGLGLVAIAAMMTYVLPEAWLIVAFGAIGGVLLGVVLVLFGRRARPSSGPSGADPAILFRQSSARESDHQTNNRTDGCGAVKELACLP